jgi:hypothetical protein
MAPSAIMDVYRRGDLDALLMHGQGGMLDEDTEKAVVLVDSMEKAFGVPNVRVRLKDVRGYGGELIRRIPDGVAPAPPPDLVDKVNAVKRVLR